MEIYFWLPPLLMGFMSSAHCVGMCGGIMGALSVAIPAEAVAKRWWILLAYNLGRILSYTAMGLLVGLLANQLAHWGALSLLRILAGLLLIATGLYMAQWWQGLLKVEALGKYLWAYLQPLGRRFMPVNSLPKALSLGCIWGWLPCGLVYSALTLAMTQASPTHSGIAMLAFGLGTLPSVLAAGVLAQALMKLFRRPMFKGFMALAFIVFGCWTIWGVFGWGALGHGAHAHHHALQQGQPIQLEQRPAEGPSAEMDHSNMHLDGMNHEGMNHEEMDHTQMQHDHSLHMAVDDSTAGDTRIEAGSAATSSSVASDMNSAEHHHHHAE